MHWHHNRKLQSLKNSLIISQLLIQHSTLLLASLFCFPILQAFFFYNQSQEKDFPFLLLTVFSFSLFLNSNINNAIQIIRLSLVFKDIYNIWRWYISLLTLFLSLKSIHSRRSQSNCRHSNRIVNVTNHLCPYITHAI